MNIKIIVATHKKYQIPKDSMYFPLHVGAQGKQPIGLPGDNSGENISTKNPFWCELTGLYWAWKNLDYDYLGLVQYRRHFKGKNKSKDKIDNTITKQELEELFKHTDIILPKKRYYFIETLYSHYAHTHYEKDLQNLKKVLNQKYPEYLNSFDIVMKRRYAHMFNMFVMKKEILDGYCKWLFDILFELEKRMKNKEYDQFHSRFYGRVSELLLDVYLNTNNMSYKEVKFMDMENVNWWKKGTSFLKAKLFGKKYEKSF